MDYAKNIFDIFDLFFGFGAFICAGFFYFVYKVIKERQAQFNHSTSTQGTVIETVNGSYPVIEFERDRKTVQFTSSVSIPGVKTGQQIDLEISAAGVARVKTKAHSAIQTGLLLIAVAFLVAGCLFIVQRFA